MNNPGVRKIKSQLYEVTYNLIDANEVAKFVPIGNGNWQKQILLTDK